MLSLLSDHEIIYFIILLLTVATILIVNATSSNYYSLWSPLTVVALTYFYYTIAGPFLSLYLDETYVRLVDHRPYFLNAWKAALLSLMFIILGYLIPLSKYTKLVSEKEYFNFKPKGTRLYILGFIGVFFAFGITSLTSVNFFSGDALEQSAITGGFRNYFLFMMNLFVPALSIMLISRIKGRYSIVIFVLALLYAVALYLTLGFRYRIILLVISLLSTYYLYKKVKPNFVLLLSLAIVVIALMGFIGSARTYFSGFGNYELVKNKSFSELFLSGFGESQTFQSTGLLIEDVPYYTPHLGLKPFYETVAMPIPRAFWPSKPSGESLNSILDVYYFRTGMPKSGTGAAVLNFGEQYLAFGWYGIVFISLLLGIIFRRVWEWFLVRKDESLAVVFIAVFNSFIYVIISRGYLPQVVMNFFFTVGPLLYYIRVKKQRIIK